MHKLLKEYKEKNRILTFKELATVIYDWFNTYQGDTDYQKMVSLYTELIREEQLETRNAWLKKHLYAVLDGLMDILWVRLWQTFFLLRNRNVRKEDIISILESKIADAQRNYELHLRLFILALSEVAYSNFTKSKEKLTSGKKKAKIIKGPNYKAPDWDDVFKRFKEYIKGNQI